MSGAGQGGAAPRRTFALTVAYDGSGYGGWQRQENAVGVQQRLEAAIALALGEECRTLGSGRTDAGVHAFAQIVRLRAASWRAPAEALVPAINRHLPPDIAVQSVREAVVSFHPIRDAVEKTYRYNIRLSKSPDPFEGRTAWYMPRPLRVDAFREAAAVLEGTHDFASFQSLGSPRVCTVRTIRRVEVAEGPTRHGRLLRIDMTADGFLYNMARSIVGTLVAIAAGGHDPRRMGEVIAARNRRAAGQTAPACGLCLMDVRYPAECFLDG